MIVALDQDPDASGNDESDRNGDEERRIEKTRRVGPDHLLHDVGRVGPEHDQLAMGHVDDPHEAECDRQPHRRKQQHRAQRNAVPEVLHAGPYRKALIDAGKLLPRGGLDGRRDIGRQRIEQRNGGLIAECADLRAPP